MNIEMQVALKWGHTNNVEDVWAVRRYQRWGHMDNVEDACESIHECLFQLCQILEGPEEFQEAQLPLDQKTHVQRIQLFS